MLSIACWNLLVCIVLASFYIEIIIQVSEYIFNFIFIFQKLWPFEVLTNTKFATFLELSNLTKLKALAIMNLWTLLPGNGAKFDRGRTRIK